MSGARPLAAAFVGAFAISFSALFFHYADVSALTGAFFRPAYAVPVLAFLWWRTRKQDENSARDRWIALGSGVMLAIDFVCWHLSIGHLGTGLSTLIANAQIVFVAAIAWWFLDERPDRVVLMSIPVVLVGVALVSGLGRADSFGSDPVLGTVLALASALAYAGFLLAYRRANRTRGPVVGSLAYASVGAAVTTLVAAPVFGTLDLVPSWPAHGWLLALALLCQVVGWLAIGYALPRLPAAETSTFILLQPVLTMVWGGLLLAERPSFLQLVGAAMVLGGVGMVAVVTGRRQAVAVAPAA
ncbi:MAG TPA: DMT family transporter [Acidimicrobiia bacterium]|nr:DMT family transporter [Acidimicrobiia bacterium]